MKIREKTNENVYVSSEQIIDRSAWRCGSEDLEGELGQTAMLNDEGNMCCLGHVCHNSGFGKDLLYDKGFPNEVIRGSDFLDIPLLVEQDDPDFPEEVIDTYFTGAAVRINDDESLSLKGREKELKALFKEHGMNLKFVGRYPASMLQYDKELVK